MPPDASVLTVEFKGELPGAGEGPAFPGAGNGLVKAGKTLSVCHGEVFALSEDGEKLIVNMSATMMTVRNGPGRHAGGSAMPVNPRIHMLQRRFPSPRIWRWSAGPRPILVDTGFGSDLPETERLLTDLGVPPWKLRLIVNTHAHVDHAGGNHGLQQAYGIPVAAGAEDAARVNSQHFNACDDWFLDHPVGHYQVSRGASGGRTSSTRGAVALTVLATPGHTPGHLFLLRAGGARAPAGRRLSPGRRGLAQPHG